MANTWGLHTMKNNWIFVYIIWTYGGGWSFLCTWGGGSWLVRRRYNLFWDTNQFFPKCQSPPVLIDCSLMGWQPMLVLRSQGQQYLSSSYLKMLQDTSHVYSQAWGKLLIYHFHSRPINGCTKLIDTLCLSGITKNLKTYHKVVRDHSLIIGWGGSLTSIKKANG